MKKLFVSIALALTTTIPSQASSQNSQSDDAEFKFPDTTKSHIIPQKNRKELETLLWDEDVYDAMQNPKAVIIGNAILTRKEVPENYKSLLPNFGSFLIHQKGKKVATGSVNCDDINNANLSYVGENGLSHEVALYAIINGKTVISEWDTDASKAVVSDLNYDLQNTFCNGTKLRSNISVLKSLVARQIINPEYQYEGGRWTNTEEGRPLSEGPTYGNWGGGCWSGGQYSCEDLNSTGDKEPIDSMDELFKTHDLNYDTCFNRGPLTSTCLRASDKNLVQSLKALPADPKKWKNPPPKGTEDDAHLFKITTISIFEGTTRGSLIHDSLGL